MSVSVSVLQLFHAGRRFPQEHHSKQRFLCSGSCLFLLTWPSLSLTSLTSFPSPCVPLICHQQFHPERMWWQFMVRKSHPTVVVYCPRPGRAVSRKKQLKWRNESEDRKSEDGQVLWHGLRGRDGSLIWDGWVLFELNSCSNHHYFWYIFIYIFIAIYQTVLERNFHAVSPTLFRVIW